MKDTWVVGKNIGVEAVKHRVCMGEKEMERETGRTGTKNIKPGTALVYEPPLENLP